MLPAQAHYLVRVDIICTRSFQVLLCNCNAEWYIKTWGLVGQKIVGIIVCYFPSKCGIFVFLKDFGSICFHISLLYCLISIADVIMVSCILNHWSWLCSFHQKHQSCLYVCTLFYARLWMKREIAKSRAWIETEAR